MKIESKTDNPPVFVRCKLNYVMLCKMHQKLLLLSRNDSKYKFNIEKNDAIFVRRDQCLFAVSVIMLCCVKCIRNCYDSKYKFNIKMNDASFVRIDAMTWE